MNNFKSAFLFIFLVFIGSFVIAQQYGLIIAENVNVRKESSSKSKIVGKIIKEMTLVKVEDKSWDTEVIEFGNKSIENYWYQINQEDKIKGWVYGEFIILFNSLDSAKECIKQSNDFRQKYTGKYSFSDHSNYFMTYYELELFDNGKINIYSNCVEGDHILEEKGEGRFYVNTRSLTFNVYGNMTGEFSPDSYSWEEYFELANGHKPTKKELDQYIKEKSVYKSHCSFSIPLEKLNELLIHLK